MLETLGERLGRMERKTSPFDEEPREKGVHWVSPDLVGEVGFTEWTRDGKLRHPRFVGLRTDKDAKDVHRERARAAPE
jgi:bifunctional non-homologous end joining protein LigD